MSFNVIGLYKNQSDAQATVDELLHSGFTRDQVSIVTGDEKGEYQRYLPNASTGDITHGDVVAKDATKGAEAGGIAGGLVGLLAGLGALALPGIGIVAGPLVGLLGGAAIGAAGGGLIGALVGMGVPESHAKTFASGVKSGGTLVIVHAPSNQSALAEQILERHNPDEVTENGQAAAAASTDFAQANTALPSTAQFSASEPVINSIPEETQTAAAGQTLDVVREELRVGKREVERGGVRVRSYITETPVSQDVSLREEHVNVERHVVDRPATPQDLDTFKEATLELRETAEVPVVAKEARVIEEVVLNKSSEQRTQTISDTVRETHVDVEPIQEFQRDFESNYGNSGAEFGQYSPAYSFGYKMASDQRFTNRDWTSIEPQLRGEWEREHPGTWTTYSGAVRTSWERGSRAGVRGAELI